MDGPGQSSVAAIPVVVFSDFACPFSYLAESSLRRAARDAGVALRVEHRGFELYPVPEPLPPPLKPGWDRALLPLAEELGLTLREGFRSRTGKAHEAAHFAAERECGEEMRSMLFAGYFADGLDLGRIDVLAELGGRAGLDATELRVVLDIDRFSGAVQREREAALRGGVRQIPTLVAGEGERARAVVGLHPPEELRTLLHLQ